MLLSSFLKQRRGKAAVPGLEEEPRCVAVALASREHTIAKE
jgi:hypothetical protein